MPNNTFNPRSIKIFLLSFGLAFAMVLLQKFIPHTQLLPKNLCLEIAGFQVANCQNDLVSPTSNHGQTMQSLQVKLKEKQDSYHLKTTPQLIKPAFAGSDYENAAGFVVIDYDSGQILAEKNSQKNIPIASLTKIMSSVVALDLASPDEQFTVSQTAPKVIPTRLALTPGEKFTVEELINAALLTSANDCTQVLKEGVDAKYQDKVFIDAMNAKAELLGLNHSHFTNPQGFDNEQHFSSAQDVARLSHYALTNYPVIAKIAQKDHEVLTASPLHTESWLNNWNGLIEVYPGTFGLKIGNTDDAGFTTVVASQRDGHKVLVVLLGAPGVLERDLWASQLLDLGFERLAGLPAINVTATQLRAKYQTWKYFN